MNDKVILDPCCGSKMFWFDKNHPLAIYGDVREAEHILCDGRTLSVRPDMIMDVTELPFEDKKFKLVILDLPHLKTLGAASWMALKYGVLPKNWQPMIQKAMDEGMRVLDEYGILVFKWNESEIKTREILDLIPYRPIVGHTSGRQSKTIWLLFMKTPTP